MPVNSVLKASLASSSSIVKLPVELPGELWSAALSQDLIRSSEIFVLRWMGIVKAALCGCSSKDRVKYLPLFFQLRIFICASGTSREPSLSWLFLVFMGEGEGKQQEQRVEVMRMMSYFS